MRRRAAYAEKKGLVEKEPEREATVPGTEIPLDSKQEKLSALRKLMSEPQKPSGTLEDTPVIDETRSAKDVVGGIYRNDHGGVISKSAWEKLQRLKEHAKANNFVIDEYSQ